MIGHFLGQIDQPLEIVGIVVGVVDDQLFFTDVGLVGVLVLHRFFVGKIGILLPHFEQRVLGHLLLDALLELHDGQLQNLHRLDHSRRQFHRLDLRRLHAE